ncbi:hypothetical protein HK107_01485 [Parvularcula sp. ZS-1/3]|uniref:Uncharacterized protein n=1 Tax=Parvularcula mediterranea TaxID=2732508 RepID=A0A7Y3RJ41_9PROT|nr:hypothetical protein [Parvularcula mediterranea]NNU14995.1 hypothetical protein [Parvularcula mediterranea]
MLPFPRAHYYVLAFLVLTFIAFSPSYFLRLGEASFAHHLHGITATLWIVLLASQSWSIHNGRWKVHAWSGRMVFILLPLFLAGGLLATKATLVRTSAFNEMFGTALAFADVFSTAGFALLVWLALRHRKTPDLHARFMLGTITPLIGPSLARLFANFIPPFAIRGPDQLYKFGWAVDAAFLVALLFFAVLIIGDLRKGKPAWPFVFALVINLIMWMGYKWIGYTDAWISATEAMARVPGWLWIASGLVMGIAAVYDGWTRPASPKAPRGAAAPA